MRERGGRTLPFVCRRRKQSVPTIRERVRPARPSMRTRRRAGTRCTPAYDTKRINHSIAFCNDGACTNQAESYFSRLRRAEWGQHHHISGKYLGAYAREMAWREDPAQGERDAAWAGGGVGAGAPGVADVGGVLAARTGITLQTLSPNTIIVFD